MLLHKDNKDVSGWMEQGEMFITNGMWPSMRCLSSSLLVLLCTVTPANAGPDPLPTDTFPAMTTVNLDGNDLVFNGQYRVRDGNWANWPKPLLDNKKPDKRGYRSRQPSCSVPSALLKKYGNNMGPAAVLYCDKDRVWFASSSYCSEGEKDQGHLYAYDLASAAVIEHKGVTPRCETIIGAVRVGNRLWMAAVRPGEYGPYGGSGVLVFDLDSNRLLTDEPALSPLTDRVLTGIGYHPKTATIWVATRAGLDRYSLKHRAWEHRYFDIETASDNKLLLILSEKPPTERRLWMAYHLYFYPIDDLRGFARAWDAIDGAKFYPPVKDDALVPYYIAALRNMDSQWNDYAFIYLLQHIASHDGAKDQVRTILDHLSRQQLNTPRRTATVELRKQYGIAGADSDMDRHFELLRDQFFSAGHGLRELCDFAFKNTGYLTSLNLYFVDKPFDSRTDPAFLDECVRARQMWAGMVTLFPSIKKGMSTDDGRSLYATCIIFNHYAKETFRRPEMIVPILAARRRAEQLKGRWGMPDKQCLMASYWIANSRDGIDALLSELERHPELTPLGEDVLSELTGMQFKDMQEWRGWWLKNRQQFQPRQKTYYWDPNKRSY